VPRGRGRGNRVVAESDGGCARGRDASGGKANPITG
jgi:hypothetical protein